MFWRDLGFLLLLSLGVAIAGVFSSMWVWNNQNIHDELQDVLFDLLPDLSHIEYPIPNYIIIGQYGIAVLSLPFGTLFKRIAQFLFLINILTLIRAITVSLTLLPNIHVYDYCKERPDTFWETLRLMMQHGTCADYMFSGHTSASFLMYMFVQRHTYHFALGVVQLACVFAIALFLVLQRWHYTIDIVIAILLVWLVFFFYKQYEVSRRWRDHWFYFKSFEWNRLKLICKPPERSSRKLDEQSDSEFRVKRIL